MSDEKPTGGRIEFGPAGAPLSREEHERRLREELSWDDLRRMNAELEALLRAEITDCKKEIGSLRAQLAERDARIKALAEAMSAWINWMDSPGDGTDLTLEDEERMLDTMRALLAKDDPT